MRAVFKKYREIVLYLVFGVIVTVVSMATYFAVLAIGELLLNINAERAEFYLVRTVAQIVQWIVGVLVAFFTNKKYVFEDKIKGKGQFYQLAGFAGGRLLTLFLDTAIVFGTVWMLSVARYEAPVIMIPVINFGFKVSADVLSKVFASVAVVISNYFISKLIIFRKSRDSKSEM